MNITANSYDLIKALNVVTKALPSKTTNQILEGVLIEAGENGVTMTCTDERMTIVTKINAKIKESGIGVVPGKLFNEVVKNLSGSDINIKSNEKNVFTVRGFNSRTNISGQSSDLFPSLPDMKAQHKVSVPQPVLKDMITKTEFAVALEDMRETLTGAYLEITKNEINMVGLDGYRMAVRRMQTSSTALDNCSAIVPGKVVSNVAKLLSDNENDFAYISIGGGKLHIQFGDTDVYTVLINGDYVKYKALIPKDFTTQLEVDVEQFRKAIDRASLIARQGNNNLLIFRIMSGEVAIESKSEIGDVHEKLEVIQTGNDLNIAFNVKYLMDVVRNIGADTMNICMNSSATPCIITPVGDGNYIHLVLPVRTNSL